jgi:periplasmic protein TonB
MRNRDRLRTMSTYFLWAAIIMALALHLAFLKDVEYKPKPYQLRQEEVIEVYEPPPEIEIPPAPKEIAQSIVVGVAAEPEESEDVDDNVTIAQTDFNVEAPAPAPPPPPPKIEKPPSPKFVLAFDVKPEVVTEVKPKYPELARNAGIEGIVRLVIIVKEDGTVDDDIKVVTSLGFGCDEAAIAAIKHWKFTPGRQNDKAVPVQIAIPVRFKFSE